MSIKRRDMFTAVCDWPECEADVVRDGTDYSGWGDVENVNDTLDDADWWRGREGDTHYCNRHLTVWASDYEDAAERPEPPYLLIHDGDTGDLDDDGKVSRVVALSEVSAC